jgi:hypothetical protein
MPESLGRPPIGLNTLEAMMASDRRPCSAQHGFRHAVHVGVGSIEEVHAGIERGVDHARRFRLVGTVAEGHGAETDFRDFQAAAAETTIFHAGSPKMQMPG